MGRFYFRTTEGTGGFKLAHMFFRCMGRSRQWFTGQMLMRKMRVGSCGNGAYQLSIGLLREGASAGFASSAMSYARHQNRCFQNKKLIFRELDRPFETAPKTARIHKYQEPQCLYSCTCDLPEEFQEIDVLAFEKKKRYENIVAKFSFKASGAAAARPSCMSLVLHLSNQDGRVLLSPRPHRTSRAKPPV